MNGPVTKGGLGVAEHGNRAVFLDRDGTIIEDVDYLTRVDQMRILPGAAEALSQLKAAGFLLIVVTNQSAIARGWLTEEELGRIHAELNRRLAAMNAPPVDAFYACPHLPGGAVGRYAVECRCRKPQPGLLEQAQRDWDVDMAGSYMVGDSQRDVVAGRRAGCCPVLIGPEPCGLADATVSDLREAARWILAREEGGPA